MAEERKKRKESRTTVDGTAIKEVYTHRKIYKLLAKTLAFPVSIHLLGTYDQIDTGGGFGLCVSTPVMVP